MPNHVINELIFRVSDEADRSRILAAICDSEGETDFEILVPVPLNVWRGDVGSVHMESFKRVGIDWQRENWGTKWNAYGHKPIERTDEALIIRFETAWRPPYAWLAAVFNHLRLPFEHNWLDEGRSASVAGKFSIHEQGGNQWSEIEAPEALHRHLHKLLWGVEEFEDETEGA